MIPSTKERPIIEGAHHYISCGLHVASAIEFPELIAVPAAVPDVVIQIGEVPDHLSQPKFKGARAQGQNGQFLLRMDGVANYFLLQTEWGYLVHIDPNADAPDAEVRLFVLSSIIGAINHMAGMLPMHASGNIIDGQGVIFAGKSGLGKSTLCAGLYKRGFSYLTDNIASISLSNLEQVQITPAYQHIRLWEDSLKHFTPFEGKGQKARQALEKYDIVVGNQAKGEPVPLKTVYLLHYSLQNQFNIRQIHGHEKFDSLLNQTFRFKLIKGFGTDSLYFRVLEQVCKNTKVCLVERPVDGFRLEELMDLILKDQRI